MNQKNKEKFSILQILNLPIHQYAITGSGPLGIRDLKEIGDVDLIVLDTLWDKLAQSYPVVQSDGIEKIVLVEGLIEAFKEGSFKSIQDKEAPSIRHRIENAEVIQGLPFDRLETVLFFKKKQNRSKDQKDIQLIEKWLLEN